MRTMKKAADDLDSRRPVWEALSTLFLDTDTSLLRQYRAKRLAESPYSITEIETILRGEVFPICSRNVMSIAGEWAGFDPSWLEEKILRRLRSRRRWSFGFGQWLFARSSEWRRTRAVVEGLRNGMAVSLPAG
jgi:hypothetical protein